MGGLDETHGGLKKRHISRNSWETIAEDVVTGLLVVRPHKSFLRSALFEEQPKSGNHFAKIFGNLFRPKVGIMLVDASNDWSLGETIEDQSDLITDNIYYQTYLLLSTPFSIGKKNYGFY